MPCTPRRRYLSRLIVVRAGNILLLFVSVGFRVLSRLANKVLPCRILPYGDNSRHTSGSILSLRSRGWSRGSYCVSRPVRRTSGLAPYMLLRAMLLLLRIWRVVSGRYGSYRRTWRRLLRNRLYETVLCPSTSRLSIAWGYILVGRAILCLVLFCVVFYSRRVVSLWNGV